MSSTLGKNDCDNKTVKSKSFGENEDKNDTDEDVSVGIAADTGVTNEANGETSSQRRQTDTETRGQLLEARSCGVVGGADDTLEDHTHDETVDAENTGHNNGDERLVNKFGFPDAHQADAVACLCSSVSSTEVYIKCVE